MVVNFEFLGGEPIENLINCMNFKIDKVVYFGYHNVIEEQKARTECSQLYFILCHVMTFSQL